MIRMTLRMINDVAGKMIIGMLDNNDNPDYNRGRLWWMLTMQIMKTGDDHDVDRDE